jgi:hypothetical protein
MTQRAVHAIRLVAAPATWLLGLAFALGFGSLALFGVTATDTSCGTLFESTWRRGSPACHHDMVTYLRWDSGLLIGAVVVGIVWWSAYRRDTIPV